MTAAACSLSCWPFLSFIPLKDRNVKPHLPQHAYKIVTLAVSIIFVRVDTVLVGVLSQALFQPNCSPGIVIRWGLAGKVHLINERHRFIRLVVQHITKREFELHDLRLWIDLAEIR